MWLWLVVGPAPTSPSFLRWFQPIISLSPAQTTSLRCSCSAVPGVSASSCCSFVFVSVPSLCFCCETGAVFFFLRIAPRDPGGSDALIYSRINFGAKRRHVKIGRCVYVHSVVGALCSDWTVFFSLSFWMVYDCCRQTAANRLQVV